MIYKNYIKDSNSLLAEKYFWLFEQYHKAYKNRNKNKKLFKETIELINGHLADLTNVSEGTMGAIPIRMITTKPEASPAQLSKISIGEHKVDKEGYPVEIRLHFEHMVEKFQLNAGDFNNILAKYRGRRYSPKKARKEILRMVETLGQAITSRLEQYNKDHLGPLRDASAGGGSREAINPWLNTILRKGQGDTSIFLGTGTGITATEAVLKMQVGTMKERIAATNKVIKEIIKEGGEGNLSSVGYKMKVYLDHKKSYDKVDASNKKNR